MKVGDLIRDNDPRVGRRVLRIESFDGDSHVRCGRVDRFGRRHAYPKKGFRIRIDRIHTDDKDRRTGFALMTKEP